jgi:predicted enzyme related to lactoylglutathione lyase
MKVISLSTNINSADPERLTAFYKDVVGLTIEPSSGGFAVAEGAFIFIDGHSELSGPAKEPARVLINFMVDDIAAEEARLKAAGVSFSRSQGKEEWGGVISTFADPDGNYVQLIQFDPGG